MNMNIENNLIDGLDFEVYKKIDGYDNYHVSNFGNVINSKTERILKPFNNGYGYLQIELYKNGKRKNYKLHRLIAIAYIPNPENKSFIDHIDNNSLNNYILNLRWSTPLENNFNSLKSKNTSSIYKGVYFNKSRNKFLARIQVNGKNKFLGYFEDELAASKVYNIEAKIIQGEFFCTTNI
jgi:hypothetical protein